MTREEISSAIAEYLQDHAISELLDVVACRAEDKERKDRMVIGNEQTSR